MAVLELARQLMTMPGGFDVLYHRVRGDYFHPGISAGQASHFLTQVMALNLDLLSGTLSEADRERLEYMDDSGLAKEASSFAYHLHDTLLQLLAWEARDNEILIRFEGDAHRWINPEFCGWWVNHGFMVVSDVTNGEIHGEASLPIAEFASRLYAFHFDKLELGDGCVVPGKGVFGIRSVVAAMPIRYIMTSHPGFSLSLQKPFRVRPSSQIPI